MYKFYRNLCCGNWADIVFCHLSFHYDQNVQRHINKEFSHWYKNYQYHLLCFSDFSGVYFRIYTKQRHRRLYRIRKNLPSQQSTISLHLYNCWTTIHLEYRYYQPCWILHLSVWECNSHSAFNVPYESNNCISDR